jgi:hypothetical protein
MNRDMERDDERGPGDEPSLRILGRPIEAHHHHHLKPRLIVVSSHHPYIPLHLSLFFQAFTVLDWPPKPLLQLYKITLLL